MGTKQEIATKAAYLQKKIATEHGEEALAAAKELLSMASDKPIRQWCIEFVSRVMTEGPGMSDPDALWQELLKAFKDQMALMYVQAYDHAGTYHHNQFQETLAKVMKDMQAAEQAVDEAAGTGEPDQSEKEA